MKKHKKDLVRDAYERRMEYSQTVKAKKKPALDEKKVKESEKNLLKLSKSQDLLHLRLEKGEKQKRSGYSNLDVSKTFGRKVIEKKGDSDPLFLKDRLRPQPREQFDRLPPVTAEPVDYLGKMKAGHEKALKEDFRSKEFPASYWEGVMTTGDSKPDGVYNIRPVLSQSVKK